MSTVPEHLRVSPALVAEARNGDLAACEAIYRRFERPVYTLAFRLCQHREDAQEVLQESFIAAFRKLGGYRGESPFWPWLKRIAVNHALMRLRRERLRRLWRWAPVPDQAPGTVELSLDLNAALRRLSPTTRAVVWLYDVEGYTHAQIAELTGKSPSFSKSRLSRAHARLREWLDADPEEDVSCTATYTQT